MPRYITEDDTFRVLSEYYKHKTYYQHVALAEAIQEIPTADVVEAKHGKWIPISDVPNVYTCSNCYQVIYAMNRKYLAEYHAFCGRCGADMREGGAE